MAAVAHSGAMLKCPSLMTIGQHDYIAVENAIDVHEFCRRSGTPRALKVFSTEETAASPGHIDNPTLAKEFVFDWLRRNLGSIERMAASLGCSARSQTAGTDIRVVITGEKSSDRLPVAAQARAAGCSRVAVFVTSLIEVDKVLKL